MTHNVKQDLVFFKKEEVMTNSKELCDEKVVQKFGMEKVAGEEKMPQVSKNNYVLSCECADLMDQEIHDIKKRTLQEIHKRKIKLDIIIWECKTMKEEEM